MTLIDTACVGQLGSLHLAALAPNVSVFNFIFQTFTFLGTATCALVARQSTPQPTSAAQSQQNLLASRAVTAAMRLAVVGGSLLALALLLSGPSLLQAMGCRPPFLLPALQYLRIRALSAPFVLAILVAQGACLGQQDSVTPLLIFAAAAAVNVAGDALLVLYMGWGVRGAAWATLLGQVLAALIFAARLRPL
ncbi:unnamed protein product, partial [Closterium sp. Naga37s-1]